MLLLAVKKYKCIMLEIKKFGNYKTYHHTQNLTPKLYLIKKEKGCCQYCVCLLSALFLFCLCHFGFRFSFVSWIFQSPSDFYFIFLIIINIKKANIAKKKLRETKNNYICWLTTSPRFWKYLCNTIDLR